MRDQPLCPAACRRPLALWAVLFMLATVVPVGADEAASRASFSLGGKASGLVNPVTLQAFAGGERLKVSANGRFTFTRKLPTGTAYNVTVFRQPTGQKCTVAGGRGKVGTQNVTGMQVTCSRRQYAVSGTVAGLQGTLTLAMHNGETVSTSDGNFTFPTRITYLKPFTVSLQSQPPIQKCLPTEISGTVQGPVDLQFACTTGTLQLARTTPTPLTAPAIAIDRDGKTIITEYNPIGAALSLAYLSSDGTTNKIQSIGNSFAVGGVAVAADGTIYFSTSGHAIYRIQAGGSPELFAGKAVDGKFINGQRLDARFKSPLGLAIDKSGNIFVADAGNFCIRKIDPDGMVSSFAGTCANIDLYIGRDGTGSTATFVGPSGMAIDGDDNLHVTDWFPGPTGQYISLRKVTHAAVVTTIKRIVTNGTGTSGIGIAVSPKGNAYIVDNASDVIHRITPSGDSTIVIGQQGIQEQSIGALPATLMDPIDVEFLANGQLLIGTPDGKYYATSGASLE